MKTERLIMYIILFLISGFLHGQSPKFKIQDKKFSTSDGTEVLAQIGYIEVPENRLISDSRLIQINFVRLSSLAKEPKDPVIYLEGGGNAVTWQAGEPDYLQDWLPILAISDLILVDQRGTVDKKLEWIWTGKYPENFLVSEENARLHYHEMCERAQVHFKKKGIDIGGYNVVENARDIEEIRKALNIDKYNIFGFSYGTHLGLTLIKLYEEHINSAILVATDGLAHSFNYPSLLDDQVAKISKMIANDSLLSQSIPDFEGLVNRCMKKLAENPIIVEVRHPIIKKKMNIKVGDFGLALILRLDIDDASDIPVLPRLLTSINEGDYSMLQWFVQKRFVRAFGLPGNGINQALASGVSPERWERIEKEAEESIFGDVVNFPFSFAKEVWPTEPLSIDMSEPVESNIPVLFISGDLDCRTPVVQSEEIAKGFPNATHLVVGNAGHEQAMWNMEIFDEAIPQFLIGEDVSHIKAANRKKAFIPLRGSSDTHPSIKND